MSIISLIFCVNSSGAEKEFTPWFPTPSEYAKMLGKGVDVDWAKTPAGKSTYAEKTVKDFKALGISHVRIRVRDEINQKLLGQLDRIVGDCLAHQLIPVLAYQADRFKKQPTDRHLDEVVAWWESIADHFKTSSPLLSFDLLIEATDAVNKTPGQLNALFEKAVATIRKTNPERILFISPRLRSDPAYLDEIIIPSQHNHHLMAEWHFFASGPRKDNPRKSWTSGSVEEQNAILEKIRLAKAWEQKTGIPTWVGAWMPGDYNDGNTFTVEEQVHFARFVAASLEESGIPFSVNSDTKFYDRERQTWRPEMLPVMEAILHP